MSLLQERLLLVLGDTGRVPVTESALAGRLQERWPTEHGYSIQAVNHALELLREAGSIHRSASGRWTRLVNRAQSGSASSGPTAASGSAVGAGDMARFKAQETAAAAPQQETTGDIEAMSKKEACGVCGGTEFTNGGKCKECQRKYNAKYRQQRIDAAKPGAKKTKVSKSPALTNLKAKAAKKRNGGAGTVPPDIGDSLVAVTFSLKIEDIHGIFHQISVSRPMAQRLVTELQEHS